MIISLNNYRYFWLSFYMGINVYAYFIMLYKKELLGDVKNHSFPESFYLDYALLTVLASYIILSFIIFNFSKKIKITSYYIDKDNIFIQFFEIFLFTLAIVYNYYLISNGLKAGFIGKINSPLNYLWILIPIEYVFYIYYCIQKRFTILKFLITLLMIISSLYKGFGGIFFFILFIEMQNYLSLKGLNRKFIFFILIVLMLFPLLHILKSSSRITGEDIEYLKVVSDSFLLVDFKNIFDVIYFTINYLVSRLQMVAVTAESIKYIDEIKIAFNNGLITPFWLEGLHGNILNKLFISETTNIGTYIPIISGFYSGRELGSWNVNPNIFIWFWIDIFYGILILIYSFFLINLLVIFAKKISNDTAFLNFVWLGIMSFLLPPWMSSFISFIYSFLFVLILYLFFKMFSKKVNYGV